MAPNPTPLIIGMLYTAIALALLTVLIHKGKMNGKVMMVFLLVSSAMGFLFFAPMFPYQIQQLALGAKFPVPAFVLVFVLSLVVVMSFVLGRTFCGFVCPIGAVQEIAYKAPTWKFKLGYGKAMQAFRALFFLALIVLALGFSLGLLNYLGIKEFFSFYLASIFFWSFVVLLVISIFIYRPFCRLLCPYAVFLSLASYRNVLRLRRNSKCIECKRCERACPTGESLRSSNKTECYMCLRCVDSCPKGAIDYCKEDESGEKVRT